MNGIRFRFTSLLLAMAVCLTSMPASAADEPVWTSLQVFPGDVLLDNVRDRQHLIAVATRADGVTQDVTSEVTITLANEAFTKLENATLFPVADGQTEMQIDYAGHSVKVPVVVKDAQKDLPISFRLDVDSKKECNHI